jgi:hypothetical protein
MNALARRSMLILVVIALTEGDAGLFAAGPNVSPESVGFSADRLNAMGRVLI